MFNNFNLKKKCICRGLFKAGNRCVVLCNYQHESHLSCFEYFVSTLAVILVSDFYVNCAELSQTTQM